jgi:hypothetical protein
MGRWRRVSSLHRGRRLCAPHCRWPSWNAGHLGLQFGANSNTAFQDWLNSSSAGTALVNNFTTKLTLTADFLAQYNVIILSGLGDDSNVGPWWTFDLAEIAAFEDWIANKGGGVIALSGFSSDPRTCHMGAPLASTRSHGGLGPSSL